MRYWKNGLALLLALSVVVTSSGMALAAESAGTERKDMGTISGNDAAAGMEDRDTVSGKDVAGTAGMDTVSGNDAGLGEAPEIGEAVPSVSDGDVGIPSEGQGGSGEALDGDLLSEKEQGIAPRADGDIASGTDGNITWVIDAGGKLTVSGTGDFTVGGDEKPWSSYRDQIVSAEVNVTGMTNVTGLFAECVNLVEVDLSGFETSNVTRMCNMFLHCSKLLKLDLSNFVTDNVTDMMGMFAGCSSLKSLDVSRFETGNVTQMNSMFFECSSLESLDLSRFDTGRVTNMRAMFYDCSSLKNLNISSFRTNNVTDMGGMFYGCGSLVSIDVSGFVTDNVTNMWSMFSGCGSLASIDVSGFATDNVTSMSGMFSGCGSLASIDVSGFVTDNVTDMGSMFYGCGSLASIDVSGFATDNVTDMGWMFSGCGSLASIDVSGFATEKVINMFHMFARCENLTSLDVSGFVTNNVTDMTGMFFECRRLASLDVSGFATENVTEMSGMFYGCEGMTSLDVSHFITKNVTKMSHMFSGCRNLSSLDVSHFITENVVYMNDIFSDCETLLSLDLSSFDAKSATQMDRIFEGCTSLTSIQTPRNVTVSAILPSSDTADSVWKLPDGTIVTELPQNLDYSVLLTRSPVMEDAELHFQVTGAVGHTRYGDLYVAENHSQEILDTLFDPLYKNVYQTIFIKDENVNLASLVPEFEKAVQARIYVQGVEQESGITAQDFTQGTISYMASALGAQKDYQVTFARKEAGASLFVNGPDTREIFLTDYFGNRHDILVANLGDAQLTGIKAELLDAVHIKLDDSQMISSTLDPFSQVPIAADTPTSGMDNIGRVGLVPDGEGEISGVLKITADGQAPVYITLTGYSDNPRIITTTQDLNMEDVVRVKYVPYSYTVETNNAYDWNQVTFTVESGQLARGLQMYPATGEIYGVPLETGEFPITVKATYSRPEFLPSYADLTLIVKDNTDGNVEVSTDSGYDLVQRVPNILLGSVAGGDSQTMVSLGEYGEFVDVYLDGVKLVAGDEYTSEAGSTRITILNQTLTRVGVGSHTLGVEFRTRGNNLLRRAAQNYTVLSNGDGNSEDNQGGNHQGSENWNGSGDASGGQGGGSHAASEEEEDLAERFYYTVIPGDNLWRIAVKFYGSGSYWRKVYEDNRAVIRNPNRVYAGQQLLIIRAKQGNPGIGQAEGSIYRVQLGDSLWKIAQRIYGRGELWRRIYQANRKAIIEPGRLRTGQKIVIPGASWVQ